jgi:RND family efflux transporter MFP subunit
MWLRSLTFPCAVLALLLSAVGSRAAPAGFHPVIVVEATYPGANAQVVADTVAAPIEQQVNGVEHLAHMVSRCTNDGRYTLLLGFDSRIDFNITQVLVQNRVALALPQLPEAVQRGGVTVRKLSPGALLVVVLTSPDDRYDAAYLGNYALLQVKDELARLAGVSEVSLLGGTDFAVRVTLDREKLAALNLTASDVLKALREQKAGEKTKLADAEALADVVVKAASDGRMVRLKDVGRVELGGSRSRGAATFDGKPAVALAISPLPDARPRDVNVAVRERMQRLSKSFPDGLDYDVAVDLAGKAPPWCLLAEPVLPPATATERSLDCRNRYSKILKDTRGVQHVLSLPENPFALFRGGPCVVAVSDPTAKEADWERTRQDIRARLDRDVRAAVPRLRDLSGPAGVRRDGYPVDFALRGSDARAVQDFGEKLAARLSRTGKLTDVAASLRTSPQLSVDIDRDKAAALGVRMSDVTEVLQVALGSADLDEIKLPGHTARVQVRLDERRPDAIADSIKQLQARTGKGEMVPLSLIVTIRETSGPLSVDRVDIRPAAMISGNPAAGVSLAEARWLCETAAEQVRKELRLPAEYGLVWLQEVPAPKPMPGELKPGPEPAPPDVTVVQPVSREVTDHEDFTGRVDAIENVDVRPRVTGYLTKVAFKDGAEVKKGDVLFEIDPRPYQAQLDQAEANLKAAEAQREASKRTLERLRAAGTAPKADIDVADANYLAAAAQAVAAKAAVEVAKLNLEWTTIRAPIDGLIGRHLVDPGNLVKGDETSLANLVNIDKVYVYFDGDERTVLRLERLARGAKGKPLAEADLSVSVGVGDEEDYPRRGTLNFVANRVNPGTGTVTMRAVLPNANRSLRPGLFARVRLAIGAPHKALLVPEEAIGSDQGQKNVYIVDKDNKVVARTVTVGAKQDSLRVITEGLQADDRVITEGRARVRPGDTVKPTAVKLPDHSPAPR